MTFDGMRVYSDAQAPSLTDRWANHGNDYTGMGAINTSTDRLEIQTNETNQYSPVLLKGLRVTRFQATFSIRRLSGGASTDFVFSATDQDNFDFLRVSHIDTKTAPTGFTVANGVPVASVTGTGTSANMPTLTSSSVLWARITCDGTNVSVKCQASATEPADGSWAGVSDCYTSSHFDVPGGMIGFLKDTISNNSFAMDDLTLKADRDTNGSYEATEHYEGFTLDGSGYATETPTYDSAGNLTYDGVFRYAYDAWNRLVTVTKGYRDSGGTLQSGSVIDATQYDGLNRRTVKAVQNSADLDCTYHYYYTASWQNIETRNGSDQVIKQQVWGQQYVDELIQIGLNDDPTDGGEQDVETLYWATQDANYNITGIIETDGDLAERYEYTPYGQRSVFTSPGSNDTGCYAPTNMSRRFVISSTVQPYGINEVGHQGLEHEEETGLLPNRHRIMSTTFSRNLQRDSMGYVDGMNVYEYERTRPLVLLDPLGTTCQYFTVEKPKFSTDPQFYHTPQKHMFDVGEERWLDYQVSVGHEVVVQAASTKAPITVLGGGAVTPLTGGRTGKLFSFIYTQWEFPTDGMFGPKLNNVRCRKHYVWKRKAAKWCDTCENGHEFTKFVENIEEAKYMTREGGITYDALGGWICKTDYDTTPPPAPDGW